MNTTPQIQADSRRDGDGRVFSQQRLQRFSSGKDGPQINSARAMNALVDKLNTLMSLRFNPPSVGSFSFSDSNAVGDLQPLQSQIDALNLQVQTLQVQVAKLWAAVFGGIQIPIVDTSNVAPIPQPSQLNATLETFT